ncbi:MAG TPA: DUF1156 domain-containing protein, partial [Pirellulales bacterium]|nr:DUF1156 domain-containing protein [Pirellulales bacterium]
MLKRLIEVALPLKEVSVHAAKEKYVQAGNVSTLHIWWARRPLAACRAVVFAALIPDPDDPDCPESFRELVMELLARGEFKPKNGDGGAASDTARNRCLEFIKELVKWENSNNPKYIEPARKLIAAAHKFLDAGAEGDAPKILDPFAGGGAIPLEALRLGCEAHAIDLNPVAYLIELCTLVYPQKYGHSDMRPVPAYVKRLIACNRDKKKAKDGGSLFDGGAVAVAIAQDEVIPDVEISEAEYRKNPLAADVKYWGHWVRQVARAEVGALYIADPDDAVPIAYLWARTVQCPNPTCRSDMPLVRQLWLCKKAKRKVAFSLTPHVDGAVSVGIVSGTPPFDPSVGTIRKGKAICLRCGHVADTKYLRDQSRAGRMRHTPIAVVTATKGVKGRAYRTGSTIDALRVETAVSMLRTWENETVGGVPLVPNEQISNTEPRRISPPLYGLDRWRDIFNPVQLATLTAFVRAIRSARNSMERDLGEDYARAVATYLGLGLDRGADHWSALCTWNPNSEK